MGDMKSGVYYYLTDNSIRAGGSSNFDGLVLMFTKKGQSGSRLVTVTGQNFEELLGYSQEADTGVGKEAYFNSAYRGLSLMLAKVSKLSVLVLNNNPTVGYAVANADGNSDGSVSGSFPDWETFVESNKTKTFWFVHKSWGNWGSRHVYFTGDSSDSSGQSFIMHYCSGAADNPGTVLRSYSFSFNESSDLYFGKQSFGDVAFGFGHGVTSAMVSDWAGTGTPVRINVTAGSIGNNDAVLANLTAVLPAIDHASANMVVTNGLCLFDTSDVDYRSHLGSVISYCEAQDRTVLFDVPSVVDPLSPSVVSAVAAVEWTKLVKASAYAQSVAIWDRVSVPGVGVVRVPPSVFLFSVYADMFRSFGNVCYPPAGLTYGSVSASNLEDSDFYLHGDALKTSRVNYVTKASQGVCVWEQRTTYALGGSDLSYANTVSILRDLKGRILDFMGNFTFRYATPIDLMTIDSGLTSILDSFRNQGFLVNYELFVPSYADAQAAGRELNIDIGVSVASDMEVIKLRVALRSAADLRAA
jgi:hypothetical protein